MKIKLYIFWLLLLTISNHVFSQNNAAVGFYCTADDYQTASSFRGKLFYFTTDGNCMRLKNTETKDTWSWKINLKNSLGDTEGSRNSCNKNDDGWVGNPAIWKSQDRKLVSMDMNLGKTSFSCQPKE